MQRFLDDAGIVTQWPSKQGDKEQVVEYLAGKFEMGKSYTEAQINERLKTWHHFSDWPLLRRELYERGYFDRDAAGLDYRRLK